MSTGPPSTFVGWRLVAILAAAAGVSQAFGRFTYSLLFTDLRDEFRISNTVAGAIGSANLGAYVMGTLIVSLIVGRLGLGPTLRVGIVGSASSLVVLAWSPSLAVTFLAMTTAGFFGAFVWITAPGLATTALGAERRGLAVGVTGAGVGAGIVAASAFASTLEPGQWRQIYVMEAGVGITVTALVVVALRNHGGAGSSTGAGQAGLASITEVPGWIGLVVAYGVFALALSLIMTFTVGVLEQDAGWAKPEAALAFTAIGVGTVAGGPVFGPMSDRLGRARVLVIAFLVMAVAGILVPLGLRPWTVVITFVFGMAFTGVPTTVAARISDVVSAEHFGAAFGAATLTFGMGLFIGPQLGGYLADLTDSFKPSFVVVVGCAIVGVIIGLRQPGR
ncbi:MAG: YbfB/YjiJ family MFS transporter [Actinomycetia bacterium]|nr:YbfB/YjiJ family MFS transporter [Actinomycetes bacterium]